MARTQARQRPPAAIKRHRGVSRGKRLMDVGLVSLAAVPAIVLIACLSVLILWESRQSPFFLQTRFAPSGRRFRIVKLRTLFRRPPRGTQTFRNRLLHDADRELWMTRLGAFLRATHLDELPQLWNVACGDMSFVGPRPLIARDYCRWRTHGEESLTCRPGLTCLYEMVRHKNDSLRRRRRWDQWYAAHPSLLLDLWVITRTVPLVVKPKRLFSVQRTLPEATIANGATAALS